MSDNTEISVPKLKQIIILLTPLMIVPISRLMNVLFRPLLDTWAWVPVILIYWALIASIIAWGGGKQAVVRWLKRPQGLWVWSVLPLAFIFFALPMFLSSWRNLGDLYIFLPWLLFGLINPCLEEGYWRGLMMDSKGKLPVWSVIIYSNLLFSLNHLAVGDVSAGMKNPVFLANTLVLGMIYSFIYYKTRSLHWLIVAHSLMDLLGVGVLVFMNIYIP